MGVQCCDLFGGIALNIYVFYVYFLAVLAAKTMTIYGTLCSVYRKGSGI